jgi:hypothetical protein
VKGVSKQGFSGLTFIILAYILVAAVGGAINIKNNLIGMSGWVAPLYALIAGIFIVISTVIFRQLAAVFSEQQAVHSRTRKKKG